MDELSRWVRPKRPRTDGERPPAEFARASSASPRPASPGVAALVAALLMRRGAVRRRGSASKDLSEPRVLGVESTAWSHRVEMDRSLLTHAVMAG
jgi:hypothetical protein